MEHQKSENTKKSSTVQREEHSNKEHDWWAELCQESAVHGMPYLARKDLHWIERIFWLLTIVAATYYAISSCYSQWERYRNNPIVYEYEYIYMLRNFPLPGITYCTEFPETEPTDALIHNTWGIDTAKEAEKTKYYHKFLHTINVLHYDNLEILEPYENDTTLKNLSFVDLLRSLKKNVLVNLNAKPEEFGEIFTEMGLCQTTTQLKLKKGGKSSIHEFKPVSNCTYFGNCQVQVKPNHNYTIVYLFIHDVNEVMLPQDRRTVSIYTGTKIFYSIKVRLNPISSEEEVSHVPIAYRKCRYIQENNLKYFTAYYPSVCRLECRINVALALCNCKPFFYSAAPHASICDITGMLCLVRRKWLDKPCDCMPLCQENSFILTEDLGQSNGGDEYKGEGYERVIQILMEMPKMGMKRRVVFSTDQLIMSLGGAIGLFMGASFMTIYGLIYLALYFLVVKCKCRPRLKKDKEAPYPVA